MNHPIITLARAYLYSSTRDQTIKRMAIIACFALTIATTALLVGITIMHGFTQATYTQLKTVHADLQVSSKNGDRLDWDSIKDLLAKNPAIKKYAPTSTSYVMLSYNDCYVTSPVMLKAIDPDCQQGTVFEEKTITADGQKSLSKLLDDSHVLMGKGLAQALNLSLADTITLLYSDPESYTNHSISFERYTVKVSGYSVTGIHELDESLLLCSFDLYTKLFPNCGVSTINIFLQKGVDPDALQQELEQTLDVVVQTWQQQYPALIAALDLEKKITFLVLGLLALLASIILMALMYMIITHKKKDIAILYVMGLHQRMITGIFLVMGLCITIGSCCVGLILAVALLTFVSHYHLIQLPDAYYVSTIPLDIDWYHYCIAIAAMSALSVCALIIPIRSVCYATIARTLKQN